MFLITLLAVVLILRKYLQQKELFLFGYLDCSVKKINKNFKCGNCGYKWEP